MSDLIQSIRVVLADDHAVVRAGTRQFLELDGDVRVVAEAEDGEQAKALIEQHRPDVAVLDIQMPGASGIEVCRWVRSRYKETGVLILTAYEDDPYVLAVLQAGANGYVLKTAPPAEVLRAVREVYEGRSALDPGVLRKVMAQMGPAAKPAGITNDSRDTHPVEPLTDREAEVLRLAGRGYTNKAIGLQLAISDRTVQGHLAHIYDKLQAASRTEAVMRAVSLGWLPADLGEIQTGGQE
jgi:DNA-binding NarL/FixJ family response regulator